MIRNVLDIISTLQSIAPTSPIFTLDNCNSDERCILFNVENVELEFEPKNELEKLVFSHFNRLLRVNSRGFYYKIVESELFDHIDREVQQHNIAMWMRANKKTQFRRTKLSKDIHYAKSESFKSMSLELFLDAKKYGISLDKNEPIKPIHKFLAAKFQAMVEAECPQ